jgi:hypothetical protein
MKNTVTMICCLLSMFLSGQTLTLTQAKNEPVPGDTEPGYPLDTSAFASGLPLTAGSGKTWDFSALKTLSGISTFTYMAPDSAGSASYPGCTVVQAQGDFFNYMKSVTTPSTQTELLGFNASSLTVNFSNPGVIARYPISYGSTSTDNISGTFSGFSFNGTCSGNIVTTADGSGTLVLPGNATYASVLRVKSVQSLNFSIIVPMGSIKQTMYAYFHSMQKFPLLTVSYTEFVLGTGSPSVAGTVVGSTSVFTDIADHGPGNTVRIYPIPADDVLHISGGEIRDVRRISIYNSSGQVMYAGTAATQVDVSLFSPGVYLLIIDAASGRIVKKFLRN